MIAIVLALASAAAYGTSDFGGGLLSARLGTWRTALATQLAGVVVVGAAALLTPHHATATGVIWALISGLGTGTGVAFLYRGLAAGRMGVVAPISGVGAAVVPAALGVATGDHPSALAWGGIVLALPAIYLVASGPSGTRSLAGIADGVLAGLGFGVGFAALSRVHASALWPVALNEVGSAAAIVVGAIIARATFVPRGRASLWAVVPGVLGGAANFLFLVSTHHGLLTVSAIISSLYPAATVILAVLVLRERIGRGQAAGLGLCAVAVALVAAG